MSPAEFDSISYDDLAEMSEYIQLHSAREQKNGLIESAFTAWQLRGLFTKDVPQWDVYLDKLGLVEKEKLTKSDREREANAVIAKVNAMLDKAKGG